MWPGRDRLGHYEKRSGSHQRKLTTAIGNVTNQGGLIAKNHEEVEELKRLGERNIFEFSLAKTKTPQKVGPIQLQLTKVDSKHYRYTVIMVVDDKQIEKKDKTLDELMQISREWRACALRAGR